VLPRKRQYKDIKFHELCNMGFRDILQMKRYLVNWILAFFQKH